MRIHLLTVEATEQSGEIWKIAPLVPMRSLRKHGPGLMMPMRGEEVELRLPDGHIMTAHIAMFGIDAWKDSEGNLFINTDPSDPSLTLTITCPPTVTDVPPGTEIWLSNARFSSPPEVS